MKNSRHILREFSCFFYLLTYLSFSGCLSFRLSLFVSFFHVLFLHRSFLRLSLPVLDLKFALPHPFSYFLLSFDSSYCSRSTCNIEISSVVLQMKHSDTTVSLDGTSMNCINWNRGDRGSTVVKVLCYKSEGRWFDPSWCHWNFSLT